MTTLGWSPTDLAGRELRPGWNAEPVTTVLAVDLRVVPFPRSSGGLVGPVVTEGLPLGLLGVDHLAAPDADEVTDHERSAYVLKALTHLARQHKPAKTPARLLVPSARSSANCAAMSGA